METEILVIGAGVFGLSIARALRRAGRTVLVAERDRVGAGASATPLGVLAPHTPDRWAQKKAAQFEALTSLQAVVEDLEAETGRAVGYRRCGRFVPLASEDNRALWQSRAADAGQRWEGIAGIEIAEPPGQWLSGETARYGAALCGLSARIDARGYLDALAASLEDGALQTGLALRRLEKNAAIFENGGRIAARRIVLATGADAFRFLPAGAGHPEKGQAAILRLTADAVARLPKPLESLPLIYADRVYVVPRGPDTVAVGSTDERDFTDPQATDERLDALMARARTLCPALDGAAVVERWAGLRPRSADRALWVAPHPDHPSVIVATGGYKTGLAMAHKAAEQVAMMLETHAR